MSVALVATLAAGRANAQNSVATAAAAGAGAGAGAAAATSARPRGRADELIGKELSEWTDPATGSTTVLRHGCGHLVEIRLSGTGTKNFLALTVANETDDASVLELRGASVRFGDGPLVRLVFDGDPEVKLERDWWVQRQLAFPNKSMFADQDFLHFEVPIQTAHGACTFQADLVRPERAERRAETSIEYGKFEVYIGGGSRLAATTALARVGSNAGSFELGLGGYPWFHHGLFVDLVLDSYGSEGIPRVAPNVALQGKARISATGFFPTYAFRVLPANWLQISYFASFGPYVFELTDENKTSGPKLSTAVMSFRERLRIAAPFLRISDGTGFALSASVVHTLVPYGTFGDSSLSGSSIGWLAELIVDGG
jgi:hypothetical protein